MKSMTKDELQKLALATGAELVVDGQSFNAARTKVEPQRAALAPDPVEQPPSPPPAAPPPEPTFTQADVTRLLAEQEARIMSTLATTLAQLQAQVQPQPVAPSPAPAARSWSFAVTYGKDHEITNVTAKAVP